MDHDETIQDQPKNSADIILKISTARNEARAKEQDYRNIASKRYDRWQAVAAILAYNEAIAMFERGTEHKIPGMVAEAIADFERARDNDVMEINLGLADGRRDALATVAEWMKAKENNQ